MEGFKKSPKMQCFKEGGAVKYKSRHSEKQEESKDIAKDKAIVKKAVKIHDKQLHEGKETNLSKLKKGGRAKKEGGCVGRYKAGGSLKAVDTEENPGLAKLPTPVRNKMGYAKKGGTVKKYAEGGSITDEERARMPAGKLPQQIVDEEATKENVETREMVAGPLRKLKRGVMETFKSKSKTPMKHGGKAC